MTANDQTAVPRGWVSRPLIEVAQVNPPLGRHIPDDHVAVAFVPMRAVGVEGEGLTDPEIRPYGKVKKGYTAFRSGDVIMAKITPCMENGKTMAVPEVPSGVCFGSTEFHVIRPEKGITSKWIEHFLLQHKTRRDAQRQMVGGVGQMRVPAEFLNTVRIPVAPSAEQARIGEALDEFFSDIDAGVAALERARDKLKRYRASVLKAAVEGTLTADWRLAHPNVEPASELLKRILAERRRYWEEEQLRKFAENGKVPPKSWRAKYKEPAAPDTGGLPLLPDSWCWATIDQLTSKLMNGFGKRYQAAGSPCIVLRLADVFDGKISYDKVRRINCTDDQVRKYEVNENDLLILRVNGSADLVGRFVSFKRSCKKILFCDHFIRAQCVSADTAAWLRNYADGGRFRSHVDHNKVSSAGQNTINQNALLPFSVPLPPIAEQQVIAEAIEDHYSVTDHLKAEFDAKLNATQGLRQAILRQAFTGRLVPQDPSDESASDLLKRIADERVARNTDGGKTDRRRSSRNRKAETTAK